MLLWKWIADESAAICRTSATMDFKTVQVRCEHEGISFLTISLPNFGKDFERSLDQGRVDRRLFPGFRRKGELPRFLGGFLDLVFNRDDGVLLDNPSIDAILAVRQLTLMFGKILIECSDARKKDAILGFLECEKEVRISDEKRRDEDLSDFRRISSMLFADLFTDVDRKVYYQELVPKHGPGATADRLRGNAKFNVRSWPVRLEGMFPYGEYALPNWRYFDQLDEVDFLEPGREIPVRVTLVPKTLKTPRIIAIEPTAMQYAQQSLMAEFVSGIERDNLLSHFIGFTDQVPNQDLAREGSRWGTLATLDLSEASDRVSNQLVRNLLRHWPHLHGAVDSCRSRKADVPGHGVIRLAKFASMGSALTFPIEAMVFLTVVLVGIERELRTPLTRKIISDLRGSVRVYGDDIIVPVDYVQSVVSSLETFGFLVNERKSFWNGKFRESCGKEFYDGHDVSIVRVRKELPTHRSCGPEIVSLVEFRNHLYLRGYWATCERLDSLIRKLIKFPVVESTSPVVGRLSFLGHETEAVDPYTHAPLVKGYVEENRLPSNPLDGVGALHKFLLSKMGEDEEAQKLRHLDPLIDKDHLVRSGRPQRSDIKLRWASPF